mmetsp:Transcript_33186/g.80520  ORF Transcript_33186/g.80520 Transcript_33186/m.80520 type:complete len:206 (+) Transcript_33186:567-1184(+)
MAPKSKKTTKAAPFKANSSVKRSREEWHDHVLSVLKQQKKIGSESVPVKKLVFLCQYSGEELSFKNNILSKLKTQKKAIEYPQSGHVKLTKDGETLAAKLPEIKMGTNKDAQEYIKETYLSSRKSHQEVFDFLAKDHKPHSWREIGEACSGRYDSDSVSFRNNIMTKLISTFGIVKYVDEASAKNKNYSERQVQLSDMCYPHGRE